MTGVTAALHGLVEATVCVVSHALDLEALFPPGVRIVRVAPGEAAFEPTPITLVVLDARSFSPAALAEARRSKPLATVPALLVAEDEDDPALEAVGADEIVAPPFDRVTSRVRTLIELGRTRYERQRFDQAILDGVDVGIVTTDAAGRVTFVNRFARDVLRHAGPFDGEDVRNLLALPSAPDATLAEQSERRWAHSLRAGDQDIELDITLSRADEAAHEHLGFFFIFHDRTQEKQLEIEQRRFDHLAAMGTMVAGFAHEIRNPMASLRSLAESLGEELAEANLELPHVHRMLTVLERVERLVRSSLVFGRPSPPRSAPHRPWTILSSAVSSMHARTRALGGELRVEVDPELPDVFVDDGQIGQVLVILLNNALDATGSPSHVLLRARHARVVGEGHKGKSDPPPGAFIRFDVVDDGPGVPPENRERIFDPFFTTAASGTGLGLAIAQQLATENGARIELASALGGPTTFSVHVPVAGGLEAPFGRR